MYWIWVRGSGEPSPALGLGPVGLRQSPPPLGPQSTHLGNEGLDWMVSQISVNLVSATLCLRFKSTESATFLSSFLATRLLCLPPRIEEDGCLWQLGLGEGSLQAPEELGLNSLEAAPNSAHLLSWVGLSVQRLGVHEPPGGPGPGLAAQ